MTQIPSGRDQSYVKRIRMLNKAYGEGKQLASIKAEEMLGPLQARPLSPRANIY